VSAKSGRFALEEEDEGLRLTYFAKLAQSFPCKQLHRHARKKRPLAFILLWEGLRIPLVKMGHCPIEGKKMLFWSLPTAAAACRAAAAAFFMPFPSLL